MYSVYRRIAERSADESQRLTQRQLGDRLAAIQRDAQGSWLFRLWFEVLAHAGRDDRFRELAAGFWSGNRSLGAHAIGEAYATAGRKPPVAPDHLASAMIALDIGLAVQHFVDPDAVSLDLYPELFELLFGPFEPPRGQE